MSEELQTAGTRPFGETKDGLVFNEDSPEVKAELEKNPDLTVEAAIGNVVMAHEKTLE